ncbi:MAG: VanZ family protein [Flavobacteriaceae bacterium]|nr:VanZ family protein [Flavobacteriaceae bacterium]
MLQRIKKLLELNAIYLAIIATIIVAILSLTKVPDLSMGFNIKSSDKYLHIFAYFILSCVWYFALQKKIKNRNFRYTLIISIILYGILLEILQGGITNYRTGDFYDVIANTTGIALASILFNRLLKWFNTI